MNAQKFVTSVREVVMNGAVGDTIGSLEQPPGRRPETHLVALSKWYLGLAPTDKDMVR